MEQWYCPTGSVCPPMCLQQSLWLPDRMLPGEVDRQPLGAFNTLGTELLYPISKKIEKLAAVHLL